MVFTSGIALGHGLLRGVLSLSFLIQTSSTSQQYFAGDERTLSRSFHVCHILERYSEQDMEGVAFSITPSMKQSVSLLGFLLACAIYTALRMASTKRAKLPAALSIMPHENGHNKVNARQRQNLWAVLTE